MHVDILNIYFYIDKILFFKAKNNFASKKNEILWNKSYEVEMIFPSKSNAKGDTVLAAKHRIVEQNEIVLH